MEVTLVNKLLEHMGEDIDPSRYTAGMISAMQLVKAGVISPSEFLRFTTVLTVLVQKFLDQHVLDSSEIPESS